MLKRGNCVSRRASMRLIRDSWRMIFTRLLLTMRLASYHALWAAVHAGLARWSPTHRPRLADRPLSQYYAIAEASSSFPGTFITHPTACMKPPRCQSMRWPMVNRDLCALHTAPINTTRCRLLILDNPSGRALDPGLDMKRTHRERCLVSSFLCSSSQLVAAQSFFISLYGLPPHTPFILGRHCFVPCLETLLVHFPSLHEL
ncbi:hypothetical protein N658DRAFT_21671 [Parathielavia hyrcaniae]|uniref:Uncharacterized protein n=1 Tax=Parathielavia hyrcaniae TaxID=113614 RepID=A0AAN6QFL5_9PEZI|nr:hypothetical protein N658DRAFT_21671 [Parathielavia hyrcaniae]